MAEPLTLANVALDHEAYVASPDVIHRHSDGRWPVAGFTLDDDRRLAARHEADHRARRAFTFLLLDPGRSRASGCLYLNPLHSYLERSAADPATSARFPSASAMVSFWLRQDDQETDLPRRVAVGVHAWLEQRWPLDTHVFRALPTETSTVAALAALPLHRVRLELPGDPRPYLWFASQPDR